MGFYIMYNLAIENFSRKWQKAEIMVIFELRVQKYEKDLNHANRFFLSLHR